MSSFPVEMTSLVANGSLVLASVALKLSLMHSEQTFRSATFLDRFAVSTIAFIVQVLLLNIAVLFLNGSQRTVEGTTAQWQYQRGAQIVIATLWLIYMARSLRNVWNCSGETRIGAQQSILKLQGQHGSSVDVAEERAHAGRPPPEH